MTNPKRTFLGWHRPILDSVVEHLTVDREAGPGKPLDLEDVLIVVPTRQAGRRLREAIALNCNDRKTAVISARTVTPAFFLRNSNDTEAAKEVSPALSRAVWARLLLKMAPEDYAGLFPAKGLNQDYNWALHTGGVMARLRRTLADVGLKASEIPSAARGQLEESERWHDIGRLEEAFLKEIEALGHTDPVLEEIRRAENPDLPDGVKRVLVAGVPAPTALMLKALKALASHNVAMEVLIHAPETYADWFDEWGQPVPEKWCEAPVEIPEFDDRVLLAANPEAQARLVCETIAECSGEIGPNDIAIGVPDRSVVPFLEAFLGERGLPAYDPAEKSVSEHALYLLLEAFCDLYNSGSYGAFSRVLRHHEVLHFFSVSMEVDGESLLTALDEFQNLHLPMGFSDIEARFSGTEYRGPGNARDFEPLGVAVAAARGWLDGLDQEFETGIRIFLKDVYGARRVIGDSPKEKELESVAAAVDSVLRECTEVIERLGLATNEAITLFLGGLADESYSPEREQTLIDLEGWLELPWNNSPLLIVTSMNEGAVPDSRLSDVFLPDRLRKAVNLPHDEMRFARDAYLLASMIQSRPDPGRVVLIAGKYSEVGDPLKPSRILFRCSDNELLSRTEHLLGDVEEAQKNFAFNLSFRLDPSAPAKLEDVELVPGHLSATQFRSYLACPTRFYFEYILGMAELDDEAAGLDPASFGTMIHSVLEILALDRKLNYCANIEKMTKAFHAGVDKWVHEHFGRNPPLSVTLSADSAKQRLAHAAKIQAEQVANGWEILEKPEKRLETAINGFRVSGRIDRIDRNRQTGAIRVVDYKSGAPKNPKKAHLVNFRDKYLQMSKVTLAGKTYSWIDLQMPLYSRMAQEHYKSDQIVGAAYFALPRAVTQTAITEWEDLSEDVVEAGCVCAGKVIDAIRAHEFWPPTDDMRYDDYENILTGTLAESVDMKKLKNYMLRADREQ